MAKGIEAMKRMLVLKAAALLALVRASELASPRAQVGHAETAGAMAKHAASTISRMDLLIMANIPAEAFRRTKHYTVNPFVVTLAACLSKRFPSRTLLKMTDAST